MINQITQEEVTRIRQLYAEEPVARRFLDWAAGRQKDSAETKVERAASQCQINYTDMLHLFRKFEDIKLGRVIEGRKGFRTRFSWKYSLRSIGKAGKSETQELAEIDLRELDALETKQISVDADMPDQSLSHVFQLRSDLTIRLTLPRDLTIREAERLAAWVRTLPFD